MDRRKRALDAGLSPELKLAVDEALSHPEEVLTRALPRLPAPVMLSV